MSRSMFYFQFPSLNQVNITTNNNEISSATVKIKNGESEFFYEDVPTNTLSEFYLGENVTAWSPQNPFLYDLEVIMNSGDSVKSYFGMRKIQIKYLGKFQRIFLNNQLLKFQAGPLDQGKLLIFILWTSIE